MDPDIDGFLTCAGWGGADRAPLAGDASFRRYERIRQGDRRAVLMVAPPAKGEDTGPFVTITGLLHDLHLSAPQLLAEDRMAGLLLLEDLGDGLIARLAGDPALEDIMYGAAVDVLAHLATTACPPGVPAYDAATYVAEARLLTQWYIPGAAGAPTPGSNDTTYEALIADTCGPADQGTLVLRDYHSENLIWLPERKGPGRVGLLDYQDARNGHAAYDLVSLLEDARRDTTEDLRARMMARFLDATGMEATEFKALYAALGAQRNLKIMGIFARLALRDQKHAYLSYIPRVWAHVTRDLAHPTLAALSNWVSTHVPPPTSETLASIAARAGNGGD